MLGLGSSGKSTVLKFQNLTLYFYQHVICDQLFSKTSAKGTQFKWVRNDFNTAYTNWGASEPNMQHVPQETEVPAYLGLGRHWITDSQAGSKRPYFCHGVENCIQFVEST